MSDVQNAAIAALQARLAEVIAERDSIRTMLLNERTEWMDEAIRRQASVNQNLAALVTDAQEELRKCQQDAIQLQARLAEAEALLRGTEGYPMPWDWLERRDALLASDSATGEGEK